MRHRLATEALAESPLDVTESLVAVHGTDPASVHLGIAARVLRMNAPATDSALYSERSLIRMHGMRRTVFIVPRSAAAVVHWSSTAPIARREATTLSRFVADGGFDDVWLADVRDSTLRILAELGEADATELSGREPRLAVQVVVAPDRPYAAKFSVGSRLLTYLGMEGLIERRRPVGGWTSNRFRWATADPVQPLDAGLARAELTRRWLRSFGPAHLSDLRWWTGWPAGQARAAVTAVGALEVNLDGDAGYVLAGDDVDTPQPDPWVALLPALDSTAMGWQRRDWYLPADSTPLFDRSGNIGPTVWCDGRVVGGWAQRRDGEIAWQALADIGRQGREAIDQRAVKLSAWLTPTVVTPRFRTPLERELSA